MSSSSAAFFAENFAGTVSVFVGAPGTAKAPLTNTAFAGGLAFSGGCFWAAGKARHGITQVRIARTGAGDKLCHGDRSLPQRFQTCTLLLVRGGRDCLHSP